MPFYQINKKVLAEFWASSNLNKKISGTVEIFENGEIEICTLEPFEDKLLNIKRQPIEEFILDSNDQQIKSTTHYYRKNSFCTITCSDRINNKKISEIKTKFNNDDEIPKFDWVAGKCEFGYFKLFCKYKNLVSSKGFKYSTYKSFKYGVLYQDEIYKKQGGLDKVRFRIDYLSLFFNNKTKLSQITAFPEHENPIKTIYQINHHDEKDEILSYF